MLKLGALVALAASPLALAASQTYSWANVVTGGGGGFVPNIIFNPSVKGLAYARTDIGGAYRLNSDGETWTPLMDWVNNTNWHLLGCDALATDPVDTDRVYVAAGMYTNSWDPNNGAIMASTDQGDTWSIYDLPFKVGGNMPGRGLGERLAVDPNDNSILYFGARSGHGLWKSTNYGQTWTNITNFPSVGTYIPDPTDTTGYNSDIIGIAFVTFDSTSGTSGTATPRIFVGVANLGSNNIFVSEDAGSTWSAVSGQNATYIPHKGVLSPKESTLYVSYSNGAGPYDGTDGYVQRYNISTGTWTDITPSGEYFGFGGIGVDLLNPGTVMVAALNSWWPDGQIYRSTDSGETWNGLWAWDGYPTLLKYYSYSDTNAPWLGPDYTVTTLGTLQIGWMMEGLSIDPFDSDHWLYGTGATIQGGFDLTSWDTAGNITLQSLAEGIEEMAVLGLISPPSGAHLLSAVGDDGGFVHSSLSTAPSTEFTNPSFSSTSGIDYAGNSPSDIVRVGTGDATPGECALSTDGGNSWNSDYGAAANTTGGQVALSANGDTVLWSSTSNGVIRSQYTDAFTDITTLPSGAAIASDKKNNSIFYGASGSSFYTSTDGGLTFSVTGTLSGSSSAVQVIVNPNVTGDVWISGSGGLYHSSSLGAAPVSVGPITEAWGIALGAAKTTSGYPAIFAAAEISGLVAYYRSDDEGLNWVQINDASHGFGSAASNVIAADPRIYGRVYVGTNGRGIFYGDASGTSPAASVTASSTTSTKATSTSSSTTTSKVSSTTTTSKTTSTSTSSTASKTSSTTSKTSSTSSTKTSTSATSTSTASAYGQCGGQGWTGATSCPSGYTCTVQNSYYSQCIPS